MAPRNPSLEKAAETHFFLKRKLEEGLRGFALSEEARSYLGQAFETYFDLWQSNFSEKFFDMTTMIRLGAAVETSLRDSYMRRRGYASKADLEADAQYAMGAFQRIQPWQERSQDAAGVLGAAGLNLGAVPYVRDAQEVMLHRHLYAHNVGLIDRKYMDDWRKLTDEDLTRRPALKDWEKEDIYWFEPLKRIGTYIENLRRFVDGLP